MELKIDRVYLPNDWVASFRIRKQVFVEEQGVPESLEYDEHEEASKHFLAYAGPRPVGTCRYRKKEQRYKLERFAVLMDYRGKGIGSGLVKACMRDILVLDPQASLFLNAQTTAIPFYEKLGFRAEGDLFHECDIPHRAMFLENPADYL